MLDVSHVTSSQAGPVRPRSRLMASIDQWKGNRIMKVRDGMSQVVLSVGPAHTLRQAARMMSGQRVGAAVVVDPERSGIGILTERDILNSIGANQDPDAEVVANHRTSDVVFASPDWTLDHAAHTMVSGGFRHLVVVDQGEV